MRVRCLRFMHDIEIHTSCYLRNLLNTKAHHDADITKFMTMWNFEELWHGEAIAAVLRAHDEVAGPERVSAMRRRLGWKLTASPIVWMGFSAASPHFLALHMTIGAINEWTTQGAYSRLAQTADHPVLTDLLRRIMKQEGRHIDYYLTRSRELLSASPKAQRSTRRMIKLFWEPVGAQVMPLAETEHMVRTLFGGPGGAPVVERLDKRIDGLPGLEGMGLMAGSVRKYS